VLIRIIFVLFILVGGAGAYVLSQSYFRQIEQKVEEQTRQENKLSEILVYNKPLVRGTKVSSGDLSWVLRTEADIPTGSILRDVSPNAPRELQDKFLTKSVDDGDVVRFDSVLESTAGFMALAIQPGLRAIAVRTSAVQIAGGFIQPEDRIDIIHTLVVVSDAEGQGASEGVSETILRNVRVLAVGDVPTGAVVAKTASQQESDRERLNNKVTAKAETITLELSEEQSNLLYEATTTGALTFALRPVEAGEGGRPETGSLVSLQKSKVRVITSKGVTIVSTD
jgi:pilus assembly protein CpaB